MSSRAVAISTRGGYYVCGLMKQKVFPFFFPLVLASTDGIERVGDASLEKQIFNNFRWVFAHHFDPKLGI
jgi:hypothetical protein